MMAPEPGRPGTFLLSYAPPVPIVPLALPTVPGAPFCFDDEHYILDNAGIRDLSSVTGLGAAALARLSNMERAAAS